MNEGGRIGRAETRSFMPVDHLLTRQRRVGGKAGKDLVLQDRVLRTSLHDRFFQWLSSSFVPGEMKNRVVVVVGTRGGCTAQASRAGTGRYLSVVDRIHFQPVLVTRPS